MKTQLLVRLLCVGAMLLVALAPISTAFAEGPVTETFPLVDSSVVASCNGFDIIEGISSTITRTTFFDSSGNPIRRHVHIENAGSYTNSVSGKVVYTIDHFNWFRDLATDEWAWVGLSMHIRIPGQGVAVIDAGKLVYNADGTVIFDAGQHDVRFQYEAIMCPLLQ